VCAVVCACAFVCVYVCAYKSPCFDGSHLSQYVNKPTKRAGPARNSHIYIYICKRAFIYVHVSMCMYDNVRKNVRVGMYVCILV